MSVKSLRTQLLGAIAMVLVATIALGSSTFAWFSLNSTVNVTGMEVRTQVSENLMIAPDTLINTVPLAEELFQTTYVASSRNLIEPVSTINGQDFYYTAGTNVKGNGDAVNDAYTSYNHENTADFNTAYNTVGAVGYVDYVFQLKAISGNTDSEIRLTKLDLTYGGEEANNNKAYRVAMFVENLGYMEGSTNHRITSLGNLNLASTVLFKPQDANNFTVDAGVQKAVKDEDELDTVTYCADNTTAEMDAGTLKTQYYKVVIRLWLEGEDNTCNNLTFMDLSDKWALDLQFDLVADDEDANAVQYINLAYTSAKVNLTAGTTVSGTATNVAGVDYYEITSGVTLAGTSLASKTPAKLYAGATGDLKSNSKIYWIDETGSHVYDVTNQCSLPVASATASFSGTKATLNITNADTTDATYQWYDNATKTPLVGETNNEYNASGDITVYCVITLNNGETIQSGTAAYHA